MRTYRIEIHPASTLNVLDADGGLIERRPVDGIDALIEEVENAYGGYTPDHRRLGRRLFDWLDGATGGWMERVLDEPGGVALGIDVADGLRHLPWELMMRHGQLVCAHATRPFTPVRRASDRVMRIDTVGRPLRVLFMACSPEGVEPLLRFEEEETTILDETREAAIDLVVEESGSLGGLRERIEQYGAGYFDVFHLTGHATARGGQPRFVMEDEVGLPHLATAAEIADALGGRWPRLVFLSGCSTGEAPRRGALPSLAEELVKAGAPAVLGWALPVFDRAASHTAASLYALLGGGMRVDEAVALTRQTLLENRSEVWHLLRLYADATPLSPIIAPREAWSEIEAPPPDAATEFLDAGQVEVCPRERFVGRRRVIQRCLRVLRARHDEVAYAEGVLLHGMGGLGKTSLAARLCERMPRHERVVIVGEVDEDRFVRAFSAKLQDLISTDAISDLQQPDRPLRDRLLRLFRALESAAFIFVFDDFEKNLGVEGEGFGRNEGAIDVLIALLEVIRETKSASRVIVTCRYVFALSGLARLYDEGLETLRGSELRKKTRQLQGFQAAWGQKPGIVARAEQVGAGNPRLLERLDALLSIAVHWSDANEILKELEGKRDEFREGLLLEWLLARQEPDLRRMVALAAVFALPVPREAVEAAAGAERIDAHLDAAVGLTLVDRGRDPADGAARYFVSPLVHPLVRGELDEAEVRDAQARGAAALFRDWTADRLRPAEPVVLEIHRLALRSGAAEIAVEVASFLAGRWIDGARFRDVEWICGPTLAFREDVRILHGLARAERILGKTGQALQRFERARALCPDSDEPKALSDRAAVEHDLAELLVQQGDVRRARELYRSSLARSERIGDATGQAATLHAMAMLDAQQGEVERALERYRASLALRAPDDAKGRASTLHQMAILHVQRGEVGHALELYRQSMELWEQAGDARGTAATLHAMAVIHEGRGEAARALQLFEASRKLSERIGDVQGQAATVHGMAVVHAHQGDAARALELYEWSLRLMEEIGDAQGQAVTTHQVAVILAQRGDVEGALERFRSALGLWERIEDVQGQAATTHGMAVIQAQQGDVEGAMGLFLRALKLKEQIDDVQGQAATLHQIAAIFLQRGDLERALKLFRRSLELEQGIENVRGMAASLHGMAAIHARRGELERAMELYGSALESWERVDDLPGKAATLHQMAGIQARRGDTAGALDLYRQVLALEERIGGVHGMAATLAQIGLLQFREGKVDEAKRTLRESASYLWSARAWPELRTVLFNLGGVDRDRAVPLRCQALWLAARVEVPAADLLETASAALHVLGVEADAAPTIAAGTWLLVRTRTDGHPEAGSLHKAGVDLIAATAAARGIENQAAFDEWLAAHRLLDAGYVLPRMLQALEERVPEGEWLFDRREVTGSDMRSSLGNHPPAEERGS